jgi:NAD(P)-binding Rossmann-like domain
MTHATQTTDTHQYDYIIVGGGPTGLALAQLLSNTSSVLIVEKRDYLGGCHGVTRTNAGMMTEHGPRIYIDNFFMFTKLLNDMGVEFDDLFVKYNFSTATMMLEALRVLTAREMAALGWSFMTLNDSFKNVTLMEYLSSHEFSSASIDILDRIGRLTDGGSADTYTLFSFLQILNQNFLYGIYQPRVPNDVGLFRTWEKVILDRGVDIMKHAAIEKFIVNNDSAKVSGIAVRDARRTESNPVVCGCKRIILACPPQEVQHILGAHPELGAAFGPDFERFQHDTQYLPYISVIFHWRTKINVPKVWGYPRTAWGVGNIVLSDYMDFNDPRSRTVISTVITMPDAPSDNVHLKVTANEVDDKRAVMNETFRQLKQVYPDLPDPDHQFLTQSAYDAAERRWVPFNHAFMTTTHGYVPNRSVLYENLFNCGVQNGNSSYSFTSIESSVANAAHLATELQPELKESSLAHAREAVTVRASLASIAAIAAIATFAARFARARK